MNRGIIITTIFVLPEVVSLFTLDAPNQIRCMNLLMQNSGSPIDNAVHRHGQLLASLACV